MLAVLHIEVNENVYFRHSSQFYLSFSLGFCHSRGSGNQVPLSYLWLDVWARESLPISPCLEKTPGVQYAYPPRIRPFIIFEKYRHFSRVNGESQAKPMNDQPQEQDDVNLSQEGPVIDQGGIAGYGRRLFTSFKNPVYRLYYYSLVGHWAPMQMQQVTRSLLIYRITGSGSLLGFMALMGAIPMVVLSLYAGVLADRMDKRKILIISQAASAVVSMGVALAISFKYLSVDVPGSWWILIVSSLLQGIIMGMMMPSRASMVPEIVEPEDLMNAISLNNMGMNVFRIIAPAATGFIIDAWDFASVYYIMTALYIVSVIFLLRIPSRRPTVRRESSAAAEAVDGLRYIRGDVTIMLILLFTLACTVFGMPFNMLLPMFTDDILMVGEVGLGILLAVSGVGSIVVSFVLASSHNKRRGIMMLFSGLILSLALIAFSFTVEWGLSLFLSAIIGLGQTGQTAIGFTLIQYYVDPSFRGRVMSFMMLGFGLASLGTVFGGLMADSIGIEWSIGGLAIVLAYACLCCSFLPG
jgi:MFS family permease